MAAFIGDSLVRALFRLGGALGTFACAGRRAWRVSSTAALIALLTGMSAGGCTFQDRYRLPGGEDAGLTATMHVSNLATQTQQALPTGAQGAVPQLTPSPVNTAVPESGGALAGTAIPSTPTNAGSTSLPREVGEISFRPGGTMAVVQKQIYGGERHAYTLRAMKGQTMILSVSSDHQDVFLGLEGLDGGRTLLPLSGESSSAAVVLPETQDYKITVFTSRTEAVYTLRVEVPAEIDAAPGEGPVVVDGRIDLLELSSPYETRVRYLIDVEKGRRLKVNLEMPGSDDFTLALYGQEDGQPYLKNVQVDAIDLEVPTTQGYYLDVHSGTPSTFTLVVEVY